MHRPSDATTTFVYSSLLLHSMSDISYLVKKQHLPCLFFLIPLFFTLFPVTKVYQQAQVQAFSTEWVICYTVQQITMVKGLYAFLSKNEHARPYDPPLKCFCWKNSTTWQQSLMLLLSSCTAFKSMAYALRLRSVCDIPSAIKFNQSHMRENKPSHGIYLQETCSKHIKTPVS